MEKLLLNYGTEEKLRLYHEETAKAWKNLEKTVILG
jgi:hypothetical protein